MDQFKEVSYTRRLFTNLIDFAIILLVSLFSYMLGGLPIGKKTVDFDAQVIRQKELTNEIYGHMYETRLYIESDEQKPKTAEQIYHIYLEELFLPELDENNQYTDRFAYYYVTYSHVYTVNEFNTEILKVDSDNQDVFQYRDGDPSKVATLRADNGFRDDLYSYVSGKMDTKSTKANERMQAIFQKTWFRACEREKQGEVITTAVAKFNESLYLEGIALGVPAFICTLISLLVFYLIVPLCMKERQTIGRKIERVYLVNLEGKKVSVVITIVRFLLQCLRYLYVPFLVAVMTIGLENSCKIPLLQIGSFTLPYATVAFALMGLDVVNLFVTSFNNKHRSLIDLITMTQNVEKNPEMNEENHENGECQIDEHQQNLSE